MLESPQSATVVASAAHAYAPPAIQYATLEEMINFFQDPPDVDSLLNARRLGTVMGKNNERPRGRLVKEKSHGNGYLPLGPILSDTTESEDDSIVDEYKHRDPSTKAGSITMTYSSICPTRPNATMKTVPGFS